MLLSSADLNRWGVLVLALFALSFAGLAESSMDPVELLSDFVGVDTVNPPGNEANAVAFYAQYFDQLGIAYETGESAPGRGNLWARLKGGAAPGLMLLQHTDVVPGDPRYWLSDPLRAEIREGYLYGRGVVDMKGTGIAQFLAFVAIAQSGVASEPGSGFYGERR